MRITRVGVIGLAATIWTTATVTAEPPPIIKFDTDEVEVKIEETGALQVVDSPDSDLLADTPAGTSAGRLALSGKSILWSPAPKPGALAPAADLADVALSPDESALALVSYIGRAPAVSSRIVILNLLNGKIINAFTFDREVVLAAAFLGDGRRLAAVTSARTKPARAAGVWVIELGDPPRIRRLFDLPVGA
ncbi:MAG: hypothetical protein PHI35_04895, partial [Victivallaceae bacterium]|nr:hypothetical protein [Victivallaceae bacterium]